MILQPAAKRKLAELLGQLEVAQAVAAAAREKHRDIQEDHIAARRDVDRVLSADERRKWIPNRAAAVSGERTYDDMVEKVRRNARKLDERARAAAAHVKAAEETTLALIRPLERIGDYLRNAGAHMEAGDPIRALEEIVGGTRPQGMINLLSADAKEARKLVGIREKIVANAEARRAIKCARLTEAEIEASVREDLREFCRESAGPLGGLAFTQNSDFPRSVVLSDALSSPRGLAAVLADTLVHPLVRAIVEQAGDVDAISGEERAKQIAALESERATLERNEELEILRLEASGFAAARRADINGELVITVWNEELKDVAA